MFVIAMGDSFIRTIKFLKAYGLKAPNLTPIYYIFISPWYDLQSRQLMPNSMQ